VANPGRCSGLAKGIVYPSARPDFQIGIRHWFPYFQSLIKSCQYGQIIADGIRATRLSILFCPSVCLFLCKWLNRRVNFRHISYWRSYEKYRSHLTFIWIGHFWWRHMWTYLRFYGTPSPCACAVPTTLNFSPVAMITARQNKQCVANTTRHT
jgi:hypothetical protein